MGKAKSMTRENSGRSTTDRTLADSSAKAAERKNLPPAAIRALQEAEERRKAQYGKLDLGEKEINGREGPEAVRYGDWEKNGIISDF